MDETLRSFVRRFLNTPQGKLRPPAAAVRFVRMQGSAAVGVVLHREGRFQAEQFTLLPSAGGSSFPAHSHPHVDSIEFLLAGDIRFVLNGRRVANDDLAAGVAPDGASLLCGRRLPIRSQDVHGATVGAAGAVFLSLQRWQAGYPPSSVLIDWIGRAHEELRG